MPVCTSKQSDQALYCGQANFKTAQFHNRKVDHLKIQQVQINWSGDRVVNVSASQHRVVCMSLKESHDLDSSYATSTG